MSTPTNSFPAAASFALTDTFLMNVAGASSKVTGTNVVTSLGAVTITGTQTITGAKRFDAEILFGGTDVGLIRNAAGILEVNNGTPGTFADLKVNNLWPAAIYTGQTGNVTLLFTGGQHWSTLRNADLAMVLGSDKRLCWGDAVNTVTSTIDTAIVRSAAGVVEINNGTAGAGAALQLSEQTAPAGAANSARLFTQDLAGKTQLMVQFGSGVAQQIAIEL